MRYVTNDNLEEIFRAAPPVTGEPVELKPPYLLKRLDCSADQVFVTLQRKVRTRKLRVLAFEEWTNGKFLRCVAEFSHENGERRGYTPRESLNNIDDIVFISGVVSTLFPEREDFIYEPVLDEVRTDGWANQLRSNNG